MDNLFWLILTPPFEGEYGRLSGVAEFLLSCQMVASVSAMITTCFGLARKTGNHQTEITGNHAPKQLVTMDRNGWSSWSEIRMPCKRARMPQQRYNYLPLLFYLAEELLTPAIINIFPAILTSISGNGKIDTHEPVPLA